MLNKTVSFLLCLLFVHGKLLAYEQSTHEAFSRYAADNSVLISDPTLLSDFGLSSYTTPTPEYTASDGTKRTLRDIVAFGSKFEDNGGSPFQLINPFITKRFFRHFFDPQSGAGLTFATESFPPSPDWALERNPSGASLDDPKQAYSYKDARDYFHAAFTCQTSACRMANFSKTFQTIGHVIHHLQDMGQPQHSRLDAHPLEPRNFYEKYTATKDTALPGLINADPYPAPGAGSHYFTKPRQYWQTETRNGKGMAEFTGNNFVTMGSMFRRDNNAASGFSSNANFPLPSGIGVTKRTYQVSLTGIGGETVTANMDFLEGSVSDPLDGALWSPVQLATISTLDAHLNNSEFGYDGEPLNVLTVNSKVFDDRHKILIPRIAAFSTDFINYFFRGRIDMVPDAGSNSNWRIVNNSAEAMSGQFDLYAEAGNGDRTFVTSWNLTIPAGGSSSPQTFQSPDSSIDTFALVFRGTLGNEPSAVTGKIVTIPVACVAGPGGQYSYSRSGSYTKTVVLGTQETTIYPSIAIAAFGSIKVKITPDNDSANVLLNTGTICPCLNSQGGLMDNYPSDPSWYAVNGHGTPLPFIRFNSKEYGTTKINIEVTNKDYFNGVYEIGFGCPPFGPSDNTGRGYP